MVLENALQTSPETIFPEKSAELCFVFPEIMFPKMVTRTFSEIALKFWHFLRSSAVFLPVALDFLVQKIEIYP